MMHRKNGFTLDLKKKLYFQMSGRPNFQLGQQVHRKNRPDVILKVIKVIKGVDFIKYLLTDNNDKR